MKKISIILLLCITLISCDPFTYLDIHIQNDCEESIIMNTLVGGAVPEAQQRVIDTIPANSVVCVHRDVEIHAFAKSDLLFLLHEMKITKNGNGAIFNPLDTARWNFARIAKHTYEAVLTVSPEDFNDK
jgi:hypothetical protein